MEETDPNVNDFENVVEQTEQFLKKFSVGGSNKKIQEKLEPSHIAASAVQELINLRGMQKQRKVTLSEDTNNPEIEENNFLSTQGKCGGVALNLYRCPVRDAR